MPTGRKEEYSRSNALTGGRDNATPSYGAVAVADEFAFEK